MVEGGHPPSPHSSPPPTTTTTTPTPTHSSVPSYYWLTYQSNTTEYISAWFYLRLKTFDSRKCIWKCLQSSSQVIFCRSQCVTSFMMTLSNENIFCVTGHLCEEFTGPRWIPRTKASDAELWCFLYLRLNKQLSKQSWGWWFEMPSFPLWRHCYVEAEWWLYASVI